MVEGCGANGCEYMTGGVAVILGPVGDNFAAGMTGGMAFVFDADGNFAKKVNPDSVIWRRIDTSYWEGVLKELVLAHFRETQSKFCERLLADWELELPKFWQIVPKEMLNRLPRPLTREDEQKLAATGDE